MNSFYQSITEESDKTILFAGAGGKSLLIDRMCQEMIVRKKKAVVVSFYPFYVPLERKMVISDQTRIIATHLKKDPVIYLGQKYQTDKLTGYSSKNIKNIIDNIAADHILVEADKSEGRSLSALDNLKGITINSINRFVYVVGADVFNQENNAHWLVTKDDFWAKRIYLSMVDIGTWFLNHTAVRSLKKRKIPISIYINKIENMFLENQAIGLGRELKRAGIDRVVYGSIFNSETHTIR